MLLSLWITSESSRHCRAACGPTPIAVGLSGIRLEEETWWQTLSALVWVAQLLIQCFSERGWRGRLQAVGACKGSGTCGKGGGNLPACRRSTTPQLLTDRKQFVQAGDGLGGRAGIWLWSLTYRIVQCVSLFFLLGIVWRVRILPSLPLAGSKAHLLCDKHLKVHFGLLLLDCWYVGHVHLWNTVEGCMDAIQPSMPLAHGWCAMDAAGWEMI